MVPLTLDPNAVYAEWDGRHREKADRVISVGVFINTPFLGWKWDFNGTSWAIWKVIMSTCPEIIPKKSIAQHDFFPLVGSGQEHMPCSLAGVLSQDG